ncbi:hypothetical protein Tco_0294307 [Tanacetum coccineum]
MPHDSPLPRVHTLGSDEGRMQHNELMDLVTKLSDRVVALETDLTQTKKVYGAAFTKLIKVMKLEKTVKTKQTKKKARIGVSDDEEYLEDPSKQGRNIAKIHQDPDISLFTATEEVYTAKKGVSIDEPVSTVGASVSTASASSTKYKGKAIIEEAETIQTKSKLQQEQERLKWEDIQARIEVDEELAQRICLKLHEIKDLFETTMRRANTFVPMETEIRRGVPELVADSSQAAITESTKAGGTKRAAEEELVLEQGMNVEALQTKYPIIDWEIYIEGTRKYWKIMRVGNHTEVYQFLDDLLKVFDRDDLVKLWSLVKERFTSTEPTDDKEREI